METECGYHIDFRDPSATVRNPVMVVAGKFVATPMEGGLRCAGVIEFGGLRAESSARPLAWLERVARQSSPALRFGGIDAWLGHRPAPANSLPPIGEIRETGVIAAFDHHHVGHHHVGLTSGPKIGRLVADLLSPQGDASLDLSACSPNRFT